jgi:bifunctional non-homologous end joining protein LigD
MASRSDAKKPRSRVRQLAVYRKKRKFDETPEPDDSVGTVAAGHSYLIQKHAARRLHYDFRLELDGVLKSWAVTRGPSLDPADKRLAVHVEDHPLAYGSFEGIIPAKQYGAGTVMLWDEGSWEPIGDGATDYARGRLKFRLNGERLKGAWMLVRMGGRAQEKGHDNWLLIKERDEFAQPGDGTALLDSANTSVASGKTMEQLADPRSARQWNSNRAEKADPAAPQSAKSSKKRGSAAPGGIASAAPLADLAKIRGARRGPLPDFVPPELATLVERPPGDSGWMHEIKIDGYRAFCRRDGETVRFLTRTGLDWTHRFGHLAQDVKALPATRFVLDGEVAVFDEKGVSSFPALQDALSRGDDEGLCFIAFDLLYLDRFDLRGAALIDRKRLLQNFMHATPLPESIRYSDHVEASGAEVYRHACQLALEGVISKRADQPYKTGRGTDWLKSKCVTRQEFVIGGYTLPKKAERAGIGALVLGYYEDEALRYAGRVGTGFGDKLSRELRARLERLEFDRCPFAEMPAAAKRAVKWVEPTLVCEVEFLSWTSDGILRHTSFQGLREDKPAPSVGRDRPKRAAAAARCTPAVRKSPVASHDVAGVTISHPDRVVFPDIGLTKLQLAEYYAAIAERILPEIGRRPLSLLRCPEGTAGQCFFQKHFATGAKTLPRVAIKEKHGTDKYVYVRDAHDLVALIQEGIVEIHPWGAQADDPDKPDRLIFDLDPAPDVKWARVVETARVLRELLEHVGLASYLKTTGGKGLHIVVPLRRGGSWPELKAFAHAVANRVAEIDPAGFTINMAKRERGGKIFLDYLRNDRGSTAVAAYSVRARAGAPVATPLAWEELSPSLRPDRFTVQTIPERIRAQKADPWKGMASERQAISAAARRAFGL